MAKVSVQKLNWRQWSEFAPAWERIHRLCPGASFFLSRDWVDCWLATFGSDLNPDLLTFVRDADVVGCCLLVCFLPGEMEPWHTPQVAIFVPILLFDDALAGVVEIPVFELLPHQCG